MTLQGGRVATETVRSAAAYIAQVRQTGTGVAVRDALSPAEAAEERLMLGLRVDEGVPISDLAALPLERLGDLEAGGFVRRENGRIIATASGRPVLDRVIAELIL